MENMIELVVRPEIIGSIIGVPLGTAIGIFAAQRQYGSIGGYRPKRCRIMHSEKKDVETVNYKQRHSEDDRTEDAIC